MNKATAIAHPIQGLMKYHGLRDAHLRIPLHDSISVCVAPYETRTTVEVRPDLAVDIYEIDGQVAQGKPYERAARVVEAVRARAGRSERIYMKSANNFISNIGLGASSSGFAALAVAAAAAYGLKLSQRELSTLARLGAGSASRAVSGAYSHWYAGNSHESSYAECIGDERHLPLGIVMAIIPAHKSTDDAHADVMTSPFLACRLAYIPTVTDDFRRAIAGGDFSALGLLAERDSLSLHAVTMTGEAGMLHWQPATVAVFHEVRAMRAEGLECYFSVDTGATPYVNCRPDDAPAVQARIAALGIETALGHIGGPARLDEGHLF